MKRRTWLRAAAVGSGMAATPSALLAWNKIPDCSDGGPTVGHGDFVYKTEPNWGKVDAGKHPVQHCHEMVLDSRGRLLCSSVSSKHNVMVYNKDGKLLDTWQLNLPEPHGLTKSGDREDQTLWLTDSIAGRVINLDLNGRILRELDRPPESALLGSAYKPTETTVADNGDIYVTDGYGSNQIFRYDSKGRLQQRFGGKDHFDCSHGIVVDRRGATPTLLITSRAANNFQRWSLDGHHLQTYALPGLSVCRPVIDGEQTYFAVLVTKSWWAYDGMVAVLDKDMRVISLPGGSEPVNPRDFRVVEFDNRTFMNPHDVCVDEDKNLYVPQWYSGRTYPIRLRRV